MAKNTTLEITRHVVTITDGGELFTEWTKDCQRPLRLVNATSAKRAGDGFAVNIGGALHRIEIVGPNKAKLLKETVEKAIPAAVKGAVATWNAISAKAEPEVAMTTAPKGKGRKAAKATSDTAKLVKLMLANGMSHDEIADALAS